MNRPARYTRCAALLGPIPPMRSQKRVQKDLFQVKGNTRNRDQPFGLVGHRKKRQHRYSHWQRFLAGQEQNIRLHLSFQAPYDARTYPRMRRLIYAA
jgi:hypothetical protein